MNIDIRVSSEYQLVPAANGDTSLISEGDCVVQELSLEAVSVEGDLWYDPEWGWSLIDFIHSQQDELITLEIEQRCRLKLAAYEEIAVESIDVSVEWDGDSACTAISFRLIGEDELRRLNIRIGKTEIEVASID